MRAAATATILGLLAIPFAAPLSVPNARATPETSARQAPEVGGGLEAQWHRRLQARLDGNVLLTTEAESGLQQRRRRDAVARCENVAGGLVLEGYESLELHLFPEAIASFTLAVEFDPEMSQAHLGRAK